LKVRSENDGLKVVKVPDFVKVSTERLKNRGFRITRSRTLVIKALALANRPLTAQSLFDSIIDTGSKIDIVSVYRILAALKELDLVHHIGIVDGYVACSFHDEHLGETQHVVCDDCGKVWELPVSPDVIVATKAMLAGHGMRSHNVKVEILVTCRNCSETEIKAP